MHENSPSVLTFAGWLKDEIKSDPSGYGVRVLLILGLTMTCAWWGGRANCLIYPLVLLFVFGAADYVYFRALRKEAQAFQLVGDNPVRTVDANRDSSGGALRKIAEESILFAILLFVVLLHEPMTRATFVVAAVGGMLYGGSVYVLRYRQRRRR